MFRTWLTRIARTALISLLIVPVLKPAAGSPKGRQQDGDDIERISNKGRIDWTKGSITATGLGAVPRNETNDAVAYLRARGYAKAEALKNMFMVIDHIHIDAHTIGKDYVETNSEIRTELEGIIKGAQVVGERQIHVGRDTMVEVTISSRMYGDGSVASVLLPAEIKHEHSAPEPPSDSAGTPPDENTSERPSYHVQPEAEPAPDAGEHYTSLIVDCRGYRVTRDMSPKIRRTDGSEVWGTVNVDPDFAIEHGIVRYAHSISQARQLSRSGDRPLVIHAVSPSNSPVQADAVISDEDANRLLQLNGRDGFLDHFNVIFVVDPMK